MSDLVAIFFTAYVGLVLLLTLPPLWLTLALMPAGRAADRLVRLLSRFILRASGCRVRVSGDGTLQTIGGAMLVSNHASYIDSLVLMAAVPGDYRFVANHGVSSLPVVGSAVRKAGHLTVDRGSRAARVECSRAMVVLLKEGRSLLVYPEGTRGGRPGLLPFRLGAFRAAVEAGRPIVPIALRGTSRVLTHDGWLLRPGSIDVTVHDPIAPAGSDRAEMRRMRRLARERIESSLVEEGDRLVHERDDQREVG